MKPRGQDALCSVEIQAFQLVGHLSALRGFELGPFSYAGYDHMGAILADAILQAGLNYRTVVAPRVRRLIDRYPEATTSSAFLLVLVRDGPERVLDWHHAEKPRRLLDLTNFFCKLAIETEGQLRTWLSIPANPCLLLELRGIGPKTVDYLKNLVNVSTVAVDRHIRNCVLNAGIQCRDYADVRSVVEAAAALLGVASAELDHAIWAYMSARA